MKYVEKLKALMSHKKEGKWAERIISELIYLDAISKHQNSIYDHRIEEAADFVLAGLADEGVITKSCCLAAEDMLADLAPVAKSFKELFIGHAHMDMNWQWSYNETAAMTIDTMRTMLEIMREYPDYTYGQSQASTYEIIDKHCHEMLDEVKMRIKEGRWEVTAAEWVEPDKNMPDGESQTRQILQAKKYLSGLLDIDPDTLNLDFVPDTFGHNANVPEILANAGVKYMYHWRGVESNPRIYYYEAPSGKRVLVYREYVCYLGEVGTEKFEIVPEFCAETGLDTYLCVYGVGDHGGGPTRRDIERICEYRSWPLTPTIEFGTYKQFFEAIENSGVEIPVVNKELNYLFTGCYTSQSRIKMANRFSEARINEAEELAASASVLAGMKRDPDYLDQSWRQILFSHFHDILPGSGVLECREHAMGQFQEILAHVNTYASLSMRKIAAAIDTSKIPFVHVEGSTTEGAGAGFKQGTPQRWNYTNVENGNGPVRAIHLFNPTGYDRDEFARIVVWNYEYGHGNVDFIDPDGNKLEYCIEKISDTNMGFWGHEYANYLVHVKVPAFGYTTIVMQPKEPGDHVTPNGWMYMRGDEFAPSIDAPIVIENENIRATFDRMTAELIELYDKTTGEQLINEPSCYFRLIQENSNRGMVSWVVGNYTKIIDLNREANVRIMRVNTSGPNKFIDYSIEYGTTTINCSVALKNGSRYLEFSIHAYWTIETEDRKFIPQLNFAVPVTYETNGKSYCDIPYATLVRDELPHDVPCLSYLGIGGETKHQIGIVSDNKYAYRNYEGEGSVTLLRTTFNPDPCCDRGDCLFRVGVMAASTDDMREISSEFNHPMAYMNGTGHEGTLPLCGTAFTVEGDVVTSCIKHSENGRGTTVRIFDDLGKEETAYISVKNGMSKAYLTDTNENVIEELPIESGKVKVNVPAKSVVAVVIE